MEIIPAIDIKGGCCVRLYQGDYANETVYSEDPAEVAARWQSLGARRLHVVDLDGALAGEPVNLATVKAIISRVKIKVQVGGGVRNMEAIRDLLSLGVQRVVLGTVVVQDPSLVQEACQRFGQAIIVGVDSRKGYVAVRAWQERTKVRSADLIEKLPQWGVKRLIYTDIARDGTETSPNFKSIADIASRSGFKVIASGGVSSVAHLKRLAKLGIEGAIVGKALYTGLLDFKQALKEV